MTPARPPLRRSHSWSLAEARAAAGLPPRWMAAAGETEFERVARAAGVAPDDAAAVARSAELSGWVRHWYRSRWVPAAVLEAVGVREWEAER